MSSIGRHCNIGHLFCGHITPGSGGAWVGSRLWCNTTINSSPQNIAVGWWVVGGWWLQRALAWLAPSMPRPRHQRQGRLADPNMSVRRRLHRNTAQRSAVSNKPFVEFVEFWCFFTTLTTRPSLCCRPPSAVCRSLPRLPHVVYASRTPVGRACLQAAWSRPRGLRPRVLALARPHPLRRRSTMT
jgi:hypothetical protein